jgi:CBS domain-containing protein
VATIKQVLNSKPREIFSVAPLATVFDALKIMAARNVGALPVMDGDRLVGLFSERDYARKIVLRGRTSRETPVREIMVEQVPCVRPDQSVEEAMAIVTELRTRHLPVVEDGNVVGIVSIGDLVKEHISEQDFVIDQLDRYINR